MAKLLVNFYQWEIEKTKGLQSLTLYRIGADCPLLLILVKYILNTVKYMVFYLLHT